GAIFLATIGSLGAATDSMQSWLESMPQAAEELETKFRDFSARFRQINKASEKIGALASGGDAAAPAEPGEQTPVPVEVKASAFPTVVLSTTATTIAGLTITLVLAYFFLASGDLLLRQLVQVLPSLPEKREAVEAWRDLEEQVSSYLVT